jgi:hypothetical protein
VLKLYSIFHLNLSYSSIPESKRKEVVNSCYWPLLRIAAEEKIPIAIEATAYTLEAIAGLDPAWIAELNNSIDSRIIEFIGSGYSQLIAPLVPADVNEWNLLIGKTLYKQQLHYTPALWYINEQAYSAGLVEHYNKIGAKAIIMEWNNPRKYHPEWVNEWRYYPQKAVGVDGNILPLIWSDSILFQKFQRYIHGETDLMEYVSYLRTHDDDSERFLPLYSNDAEIFDYRPNRYKTEPTATGKEWKRIRDLFVFLRQNGNLKLIKPSHVLEGLGHPNGNHYLALESAEQPIPVKKQEKYNINRWALSGRDDLGINTKCYQIYQSMKAKDESNLDDWKELCFLWSSDYRTHITPQRWKGYLKRLNRFNRLWKPILKEKPPRVWSRPIKTSGETIFQYQDASGKLIIETERIKCIFNTSKGLSVEAFWMKPVSPLPLFGTLSHGYYDDISLGADFYSGHLIIEKPGEHKLTDLHKCAPLSSLRSGSTIVIRCGSKQGNVHIEKEYRIPLDDRTFEIRGKLVMQRELATVHPMHFTLFPTSFNKDSLFFATNNGGSLEKFKIGGRAIHHAQSLSSLISAKQGLGATEGIVIIGDKEKQLIFRHDQMKSAVIPSIYYLPISEQQYFLRLQYSAQELDETFFESQKSQRIEFCLKISALNCA